MIGASLLTSWSVEPATFLAAAGLALAYARRARTLSRRGQPVPRWRVALFTTGIGLMVLAVASPIDAVGEDDLLALHVTQHLLQIGRAHV